VLEAQHRAKNIGVEDRPVAVRGLTAQRAGLAFGARIVDRDIETPETRDRTVDEVAHVVFFSDIGADEFRLGAGTTKLGDKLAARLVMTARNDDALLRAKANAVARPIPVSAPVIRTTGGFMRLSFAKY
jgi:hypothetical protein